MFPLIFILVVLMCDPFPFFLSWQLILCSDYNRRVLHISEVVQHQMQ